MQSKSAQQLAFIKLEENMRENLYKMCKEQIQGTHMSNNVPPKIHHESLNIENRELFLEMNHIGC